MVTQGPKRAAGAGAPVHGARFWLYGLLLAVIAICSVAGIIGAAASGQTTIAIVIGIVALAFFSRVGC